VEEQRRLEDNAISEFKKLLENVEGKEWKYINLEREILN
jgi:hypothetical protein